MLTSGSFSPGQLAPILRRRLTLVAVLVALATLFFSTFRYNQPAERAYFLASSWGRAFLGFEAALGAGMVALVLALWRLPAWWDLRRLRLAEYALATGLGGYIGWTQLFAFAGERFAGGGVADAMLVRLATDSIAVRWAVAIIGLSTLIPETLARNARLVGLQVVTALALTALLARVDPYYAPHAVRMMAQMTFWMVLAATVAIFGAYKLNELRQQVAEARRLGQYQLVRPIGSGGMGEVHLAEHLLLKHPVAIKLIRPERAGDPVALARFEREVQATARLTHWNTVQIYDYGYTDDGTFYYAMEYLPGLTLEQIVHRHGPLPPGRVINVLRQVCAALREAHGLHLVHRDIKPANIMLCERGGIFDVVKLLDFGLVRGGGPQVETMADPQVVVGTPGYMSPEQAQGREALDAASDLYAVGATAYLLLTGTPAFATGSALQMLIAQVTAAPRPLREIRPDLPADLEAVVMACLANDPAARPAGAAALAAALAACADAGTWRQADAERWWRAHGPPSHCDLVAHEGRTTTVTASPAVPAVRI
ncbi:MAG: serine/threonine-protein kinase [Vicinamibacterales bacterium]